MSSFVERRWFAALGATRSLQAECDLLFEALMLADDAWRRATAQLAEFEALRDALEREMCALDGPPAQRREPKPRTAMSAA
jgi:hypothetical protein